MTRRTRPLTTSAGTLLTTLLTALLTALMLAGCGGSDDSGDSSPPATDGSPAGSSGANGLPDVCALLTNDEVTGFTGKQVDQVDPDDGSDASVRFCQWQGADLRLAVFVSKATAEQFETESGYPGATAVDGVGDAAYTNSGHLYVLDGDLQVDVYNSGAVDGEENAAQAEAVAADLVTKLG